MSEGFENWLIQYLTGKKCAPEITDSRDASASKKVNNKSTNNKTIKTFISAGLQYLTVADSMICHTKIKYLIVGEFMRY